MFVAAIEVKALDRTRLLADVARVVSEHHVSIISAPTATTPDRVSRMRFEFELADPEHLDSLLGTCGCSTASTTRTGSFPGGATLPPAPRVKSFQSPKGTQDILPPQSAAAGLSSSGALPPSRNGPVSGSS